MSFTPGPWGMVENAMGNAWLITAEISPTCRGFVAMIATTNDAAEDNSRLIAASPELYEALEKIASHDISGIDEAYAMTTIARAALAKVKHE